MNTNEVIIKCSFTILFEKPFWIGIYERTFGDKYEICKITFISEPKDCEVYEFLLSNWDKLRFSVPIKTDNVEKICINPKRMQRKISKDLHDKGISTKAQEALKLQHEQLKRERKVKSKEQKEAEKERKYALHNEKKKAKHKGH